MSDPPQPSFLSLSGAAELESLTPLLLLTHSVLPRGPGSGSLSAEGLDLAPPPFPRALQPFFQK